MKNLDKTYIKPTRTRWGGMEVSKWFILSRVADVTSTLLNVYRFGYDPSIEANPLARYLLERGVGWFLYYTLIYILFFLMLLYVSKRLFSPIIFALTVMSFLVSISNFITLIATYLV